MPRARRASRRRRGTCRCRETGASAASRRRRPEGPHASGSARGGVYGTLYWHPLPSGERDLGRGAELEVLLLEQRLVAAIRETPGGLIHGQPKHLVDLDAGFELAAARLHLPVARDLVAATAIDVRSTADRADELAPQPGRLAHPAHRAILRALLGLDLAFGKCPVVVSGSVDHGDLGLPRPRLTKHEAARSPDHVHIGYFKDLCCHRCSFVS